MKKSIVHSQQSIVRKKMIAEKLQSINKREFLSVDYGLLLRIVQKVVGADFAKISSIADLLISKAVVF